MKRDGGKTYKAYRFRLYPNKEQEELLGRTFGCCRFIYNRMLADKIEEYKKTGKMLHNTPAQYKKEFPWLKDVDSLALANVQLHLETAFRNFFSLPKAGFPRFRAKHHCRDSYTTNVVNGNIRLEGRRMRLPKLETVRIIIHKEIPGDAVLRSVTVTMEPSGKYYASLLYEEAVCENQAGALLHADKILGIDYAMDGLAVFSDGTRAEYPMYYRKAQKMLAKEQRRLSRCAAGSRNYGKQKRKVARCHEKIRNQRLDFQQKLSRKLSEEWDAVCVEDLDMQAMSRGLHLGKGVMDNANGQFRDLLERKLTAQGKVFIRVDRFYPSSKKCSCCGRIKRELPLSERVYRCECGYEGDRDVNAAVNLREEGKRLLGLAG